MSDADRLLPLVEALFASLADKQPWQGFLRALAKATDADFAALILTAPGYRGPGLFASPRTLPESMRLYAEQLFRSDPFVGLPEGEVTAFSDFVTAGTINAEFRAYLDRGHSGSILGMDLREGAGFEARLRITRDDPRPAFENDRRALLQGLVPHLRIAIRLFAQSQAKAAEEDLYRDAIEHLALAVFILDRHGHVIRANRGAEALLAQEDGLSTFQGRLRIDDRAAAAQLDRLLAAPPPLDRAARIRITRPSGAPELGTIARAVPAPDYLAASGAALALFIADPGAAGHLSPAVLRDLFRLTPAEALLATALAAGTSLADSAQQLGIAYNTARSHLRAIFEKTGTRRQSQLVYLLRSSIAGFDGD